MIWIDGASAAVSRSARRVGPSRRRRSSRSAPLGFQPEWAFSFAPLERLGHAGGFPSINRKRLPLRTSTPSHDLCRAPTSIDHAHAGVAHHVVGQRMQLVSSPTPRVFEVCVDPASEIPTSSRTTSKLGCHCPLTLSFVSIRTKYSVESRSRMISLRPATSKGDDLGERSLAPCPSSNV